MKLIIDIPEEVKEAFDKADDINFCFYDYNSAIGKAIQNGTPLDDIRAEIAENQKVVIETLLFDKKHEFYNGKWAGLELALAIIDNHIK